MESLIPEQICCVIVTYNPNNMLNSLIDTIESQVDKIVIVDNKSDTQGIDIISKNTNKTKVDIVWNDENYGIAKALNQGVMQASEMGYDWVVTLDQDTRPYCNMIQIFCNIYDKYDYKSNIGAIGVNILQKNGTKQYSVSGNDLYSERDYLITSGCLISVESFMMVGGFMENLFIDNVDLEYCLRLKKFGKILLISSESGMIHAPGSPKKNKLFGIEFISSNHNSFRRYYMARNHIILCKLYMLNNPYFIAKASYFFILSLVKILLVDDAKLGKLMSSFNGIIDGFLYNTKRLEASTDIKKYLKPANKE